MKVSKLLFAAALLGGIASAHAQDFKSKLVQAGTITVGTSGRSRRSAIPMPAASSKASISTS